MHELSIALSLLELAEEEADRHPAAQVVALHLKLGPLAGVITEALLAAFEMAREESPLAHARLVIEKVPIRVNCPTCQAQRAVVSVQQLCCIECGTPTPDVVSGRELQLVALEIQ